MAMNIDFKSVLVYELKHNNFRIKQVAFTNVDKLKKEINRIQDSVSISKEAYLLFHKHSKELL